MKCVDIALSDSASVERDDKESDDERSTDTVDSNLEKEDGVRPLKSKRNLTQNADQEESDTANSERTWCIAAEFS